MLPSMRHFLKYVDGYEKFNAHGFNIKVSSNKQTWLAMKIGFAY